MPFQVYITQDAANDLEDIYDCIVHHDVEGKADDVLDRIERTFEILTENPLRGAYHKELLDIGIQEYREVFFKPYRIVYRIIDDFVYVLLIADGRRDMQTLLQRRLIKA
ncbi:MAG: type II toxin-antitoxin system RelE/ParE family toxin [Geoalkalibacter sp.]|jgi:toxin ParE1/3/4|uniref:type II toxin-antitoxin system RelE/ParE family toxin n=1 Tax=Geoalkalibacter sp. TaxID=3041440 RepID=UPI000EDC7AC7|nr:type II toxin-antitoxin system RelE/ParE family toxin [Thermodesulfobacteriota bacterium]HCW91430.1 plasmid stabilization protein [Marinobacter sp.]